MEKKVIWVIYLGFYSCILMSIISNIFHLHTYSSHFGFDETISIALSRVSMYLHLQQTDHRRRYAFDEIKGLDSFRKMFDNASSIQMMLLLLILNVKSTAKC